MLDMFSPNKKESIDFHGPFCSAVSAFGFHRPPHGLSFGWSVERGTLCWSTIPWTSESFLRVSLLLSLDFCCSLVLSEYWSLTVFSLSLIPCGSSEPAFYGSSLGFLRRGGSGPSVLRLFHIVPDNMAQINTDTMLCENFCAGYIENRKR